MSQLLSTSEPDHGWSRRALSIFFVFLQVVNLPLITFYDPSHSIRRNDGSLSSIVTSSMIHIPLYVVNGIQLPPFLRHDSRLPDFISDPSAGTFMLASIAYACGAGFYYQRHVNDRYQSRFIAAAVMTAVLLAFPQPSTLKSWLSIMLTLALLLSAFNHHRNPQWTTQSAGTSESTGERKVDSEKGKMVSSHIACPREEFDLA